MDLRIITALALVACASTPHVARRTVSGTSCFDPVAYGAVPGDGLSDRAAFQSAIDAATAQPDGGTVCIPPGRYTFDRAPLGSYDRFAALSTHGKGLTLMGAGPETVLELAGDQGGSTTILFSIDPSAERIRVSQMTMQLTATNTDEQTHAIATSGTCSGATCLPIRDIEVDHVRFLWARVDPLWRTGDCVRLLGNTAPTATTPGTELYRANVHDNLCDTGRSGVEVQRGIHSILIANNNFHCDACDQLIDGEATGVTGLIGQPTDIAIVGNTFDRGTGAQGDHNISMTSAARVTVTGNTLLHGGITLYRTTATAITGNAIDSPTTTGDEGVIQVANACDGLVVAGNTIKRGGHVGPVIKLVPHSSTLCGSANIGPNVLTQGTVFQAIYAESLSRSSIHDNTIIYPGTGAPGFPAIEVRAVYSGANAVSSLSINDNIVSGSVTYVVDLHASPGTYGRGVVVSGNTADNATFGLKCDGPAANFTAVITSSGNAIGPSAYGSATVEHGD